MEEIGQKTSENTILSPHAMYFWPKKSQNGQNKVFSQNLHWVISKIASKYKTKKILWLDFEKLAETLIFGQKWHFFTTMGQKRPNGIFSGKIQKSHFHRIRKPQLCAKNQIIPMNEFWDLCRTKAQTDGRRLNHKSQPRCGGPKRAKTAKTRFSGIFTGLFHK